MKNTILLFIILTTYVSVIYASFPVNNNLVSDTLKTEEIKQYHNNLQQEGFDLNSCRCISCRNGVEPLVIKPKPLPIKLKKYTEEKEEDKKKRDSSRGGYILLSIISAIGALLFGLLSLGNGFSNTGSDSAVLLFFLLSIFSAVGSVIFGIKARKNGVKLVVAILGVVMTLVALLFLVPAFFP